MLLRPPLFEVRPGNAHSLRLRGLAENVQLFGMRKGQAVEQYRLDHAIYGSRNSHAKSKRENRCKCEAR